MVPRVLHIILATPATQGYVHDTLLLFDLSSGFWEVSHRLDKDEDGSVAHQVMILLHDEVASAETTACSLYKALFQQQDLGVELL